MPRLMADHTSFCFLSPKQEKELSVDAVMNLIEEVNTEQDERVSAKKQKEKEKQTFFAEKKKAKQQKKLQKKEKVLWCNFITSHRIIF